MQTFQVTSPDVCGLVLNAAEDQVLAFLPNTTVKAYVGDTQVFEQFTSLADAEAYAVAAQADYDLSNIYGSFELTPVNVSPTSIEAVAGTSATINCEFSEPGGSTVSYEWSTGNGTVLPGKTSSSITNASVTEEMSGVYVCTATATAADKSVGKAVTEFEVTIFASL